MHPYSIDFKNAVIHMKVALRKSYRNIVVNMGSGSKSTFQRWVTNHPIAGRLAPRTRSLINIEHIRNYITNIIDDNPYLTAQQIIQSMKTKYNIDLGISANTMTRWRRKLQYTKKKSFQHIVSNEYVNGERVAFHNMHKDDEDWKDVISIDETSFYAKVKNQCGYSKKGKRITVQYQSVPCIKVSLLVAINKHGIVGYDITEGAFNGTMFNKFISTLAAPMGSKLLLDNASIHHNKLLKKVLQEKQFTAVYLPPYTPQWQPIEYFFSRLKRCFREEHAIQSFDIPDHATLVCICIGCLNLLTTDTFVKTYEHCFEMMSFNKHSKSIAF